MRYQFSGVVRGAQPVSPRPPVPCRHRDVQCHGLPPSLLGNVTHRLEPEDDGDNVPSEFNHDGRALETLSPGGEAPYGLALYVGVAPRFGASLSGRIRWAPTRIERLSGSSSAVLSADEWPVALDIRRSPAWLAAEAVRVQGCLRARRARIRFLRVMQEGR